MNVDGMMLPPILSIDRTAAAVEALRRYFAHEGEVPAYSGSRFERFAGGGDRAEVADHFTSEDLVAVTLLSVDIPGPAALRLLGDQEPGYSRRLSDLLSQLPTDVALVDASDDHLSIAEEIWSMVRDNRRVGRTKTSKLLARKRPHLLPVIDSVVIKTVGHVPARHSFYRNLRTVMNADGRQLVTHLEHVRTSAEIGEDISTIRVFDILVWMWGTGRIQ
ncbi:MAG: DUF6308 family protein [Gordonia sp. (in: high G+C Gram-positive bacteria)]|uniref:DUF6308 family protein n=1 Tax=Gordonia sp. (in: high G+C Gram-positive bacteria) TaxID=84139 RepID=UPI003C715C15